MPAAAASRGHLGRQDLQSPASPLSRPHVADSITGVTQSSENTRHRDQGAGAHAWLSWRARSRCTAIADHALPRALGMRRALSAAAIFTPWRRARALSSLDYAGSRDGPPLSCGRSREEPGP
jgi:hypothetical protein